MKTNSELLLSPTLYLGDIDGDGTDELVEVYGRHIYVYESEYQYKPLLEHTFPSPVKRLIIGDFDRQRVKKDQILAILEDGKIMGFSASNNLQELWWWFTQTNFIRDDDQYIVGDFDRDGSDEIMIYKPKIGAIKIYKMDAKGGLKEMRNYSIGNLKGRDLKNKLIVAGNFTGKPVGDDLVVIDKANGQVSFFGSVDDKGIKTFWWGFTSNTKRFSKDDNVIVANIDGSAKDGLLVRKRSSGDYIMYEMEYNNGNLKRITNVDKGQLSRLPRHGNIIANRTRNKRRDDILYFNPQNNLFIKTGSSFDKNKNQFSYWWAFTKYLRRNTFRKIARFMDPVNTPTSLKKLIGMHTNTGSRMSYRDIWNRHNHSLFGEERFMFLNTFLMDMDVPKAGATVGGGFLGTLLDGLATAATGGLIPPGATTVGGAVAGNLGAEAAKAAKKPAVDERSKDIGDFISDNIDIAALSEVYEKDVLKRITDAGWESTRPHIGDTTGETMIERSGLVTISQKRRIKRKLLYKYKHESGIDAQSAKGVYLTEFDLGANLSKIEVYNTHLQAGSREDKIRQVIELAEFVQKEHNANNFAIITGDFNIDFNDRFDASKRFSKDKFKVLGNKSRFSRHVLDTFPSRGITDSMFLLDVMDLLGFEDLWERRNGTAGHTSSLEKKIKYNNREIPYTDIICKPADDDSMFCSHNYDKRRYESIDEKGDPVIMKTQRIDYIFVLKSSNRYNLNVDFSRPRRLRMPRVRKRVAMDKVPFMSDHAAVFTNIILSKKQ